MLSLVGVYPIVSFLIMFLSHLTSLEFKALFLSLKPDIHLAKLINLEKEQTVLANLIRVLGKVALPLSPGALEGLV
jgi:hypothetical protein